MLKLFNASMTIVSLAVSGNLLAMDWVQTFDNNLNNQTVDQNFKSGQFRQLSSAQSIQTLRSPLITEVDTQTVNFFGFRSMMTQKNAIEKINHSGMLETSYQNFNQLLSSSPIGMLEFESLSLGLGSFDVFDREDGRGIDRNSDFLDITTFAKTTIVLPDPPAAAWSFLTTILVYLGIQRHKNRKKLKNDE